MSILKIATEAWREGATKAMRHGIDRHKINAPEDLEYQPVLDKAAKLLGYVPTAVTTRQLQSVLAELAIEILDTEQVKTYIEKKKTKTHEFIWYDMNTFKEPIPVHVINKAIQIKEQLPEATFSVVNYEERGTRMGAGDPFLFVAHGGRGYYIEVWDEAEFEGRKEAKR